MLTHRINLRPNLLPPMSRGVICPLTQPDDLGLAQDNRFAIGESIGDDRDRTGNLWLAKPTLSQLSYVPGAVIAEISNLNFRVGPGRIELPTSRLSGVRSNQLSYEPLTAVLSF